MNYIKITTGFVIQTFNDKGECIKQEFIAGEVEWETEDGDPIGQDELPLGGREYYDFTMVQPKSQGEKIGAFELIDHGIEHSQYFQGCGIAFTGLQNVVTGIGDNLAEAIDDCLEQIAQAGFVTDRMEARIMEQEGWESLPITPNVPAIGNTEDLYQALAQNYYHISIRWNSTEE